MKSKEHKLVIKETRNGCLKNYSVYTDGEIIFANSPVFITKTEAILWYKNEINNCELKK